MLEYQDKVVQDVAACTCDRCQRRMTPDDLFEWQEKLSVSFHGGYGSVFGDGHKVEIDLCQQCVKETLGAWLRISQSGFEAKYSDAASAAAHHLMERGGSQPGIKGAPRNRR
ncbi:hypothetical protein [Paraburkholderia tropica]|uniref:hypothetical protein n=1 Tax=Paraburkholderia tropica TaxID=92647 RepID=UPI002AB1A030|nr:hypothetical protein [Paraburkholderia tropica]